jgi:octaprenyl-diphosphate synthase
MAVARLNIVCSERGPHELAMRLRELTDWISDDMLGFEAELAELVLGGSVVDRSVHHLLDLGGKHLRPVCVALVAKLGSGFGPAARDLAVAVELMHNATLLHDDVIDLGERRRGKLAARLVYGNAASVLAGDWLLVEALKRIRHSGHHGLLTRALEALDEMIAAEAIQLENRGRINLNREDYFRVVDGKTAALFRWAMLAGATAGGLPPDQRAALERYGTHFGAAFQLVDDLLDVAGDARMTGKTMFSDLNEGKMTYPLLLALERDASIRRLVERLLRMRADEPLSLRLRARLQRKLLATGSIRDCRALARRRADDAIACLAPLPDGPGRTALATLAAIPVEREG